MAKKKRKKNQRAKSGGKGDLGRVATRRTEGRFHRPSRKNEDEDDKSGPAAVQRLTDAHRQAVVRGDADFMERVGNSIQDVGPGGITVRADESLVSELQERGFQGPWEESVEYDEPAEDDDASVRHLTESYTPIAGGGRVFARRIDGVASRTWSGPGRALSFHLELYEQAKTLLRWAEANHGRSMTRSAFPLPFVQRAMLTVNQAGVENWHDARSSTEITRDTTAGIQAEYDDLNIAETHYVSHSVLTAVVAAAESAEPEPLYPTDLPAPAGLIVFEYPLMLPDIDAEGRWSDDVQVAIRGILWSTRNVTRFTEDNEPYEGLGIRYVMYSSYDSFDFKNAVGEMGEGAKRLGTWVVDSSGWSFGTPWKDGGWEDDTSHGAVHASSAMVRRFLLAYMRWTWDRILVPRTHTPKKPERKRFLRATGRPPEDGYVKVLRLRREVEMEEAGFDREAIEAAGFKYGHQWQVRGHWRRQYYKTLGPARLPDGSFNQDSHRLVWIDEHLSGNPFGPLIAGHNVSAAVR